MLHTDSALSRPHRRSFGSLGRKLSTPCLPNPNSADARPSLHDDAPARAAHGAPPRRVYPLGALALRAVFGVGGDVDARARAVVVVAARVAPGDLVLAPILNDVACAHVLENWICPLAAGSGRQAGAGSTLIRYDKRCEGGISRTQLAVLGLARPSRWFFFFFCPFFSFQPVVSLYKQRFRVGTSRQHGQSVCG